MNPNVSPPLARMMALILLAGVHSTRADLLLLADDFNVTGTPNSEDANYNVGGRQTGALAPASWSEQGQGWQIQAGNGGANSFDQTLVYDGKGVLLSNTTKTTSTIASSSVVTTAETDSRMNSVGL